MHKSGLLPLVMDARLEWLRRSPVWPSCTGPACRTRHPESFYFDNLVVESTTDILRLPDEAVPRAIKTSITDPIELSEIDSPRGKIGITLCPGKKGPSSFGGTWDRDIETDISDIEQQFEPALILTLMTDSELSASGVRGLGEAFLDKGIQWIQLPISELSPSDESSIQLWSSIPYVLSLLMEGCNVLIHDRGGLGRAACLAAVLLIELGVSNSDAISTVRRSRRGAIETSAQEQFVLNYKVIS